MEGTRPRDMLARACSRAALLERIEAIERRQSASENPSIATGLPTPVDSLPRGVLHEWLCANSDERSWTPPLLLFLHWARHAVRDAEGLVVWIGRSVWPEAQALARMSPALLDRSLLVDPVAEDDGASQRLWTIDVCLRSPAAAVVIADVSGMQLAHSRRLQLAAEAGHALALLARSHHEHSILSAAPRRWRVERARSPTARPRWNVELVRCKGVQRGSGTEAGQSLVLEHDCATDCLCVPADVVGGSNQTSAAGSLVHALQQTG